MNFRRILCMALCVLMIVGFAACKNNAPDKKDPVTPPSRPTFAMPTDASGSVFIGTWKVSATKSILDGLEFMENGTLQATFDGRRLGGMFTDDGSTVSLTISSITITGPYTVEGDVITITAEDDVLVLTKR